LERRDEINLWMSRERAFQIEKTTFVPGSAFVKGEK
jgi:hypothetical protein